MRGLPVPCVVLLGVRPSSRRCLLTVRAAISLARSSSRPRSRSLCLMCSYIRSSLYSQACGMICSFSRETEQTVRRRKSLQLPLHLIQHARREADVLRHLCHLLAGGGGGFLLGGGDGGDDQVLQQLQVGGHRRSEAQACGVDLQADQLQL